MYCIVQELQTIGYSCTEGRDQLTVQKEGSVSTVQVFPAAATLGGVFPPRTPPPQLPGKPSAWLSPARSLRDN